MPPPWLCLRCGAKRTSDEIVAAPCGCGMRTSVLPASGPNGASVLGDPHATPVASMRIHTYRPRPTRLQRWRDAAERFVARRHATDWIALAFMGGFALAVAGCLALAVAFSGG